jgi:hypothetical protein
MTHWNKNAIYNTLVNMIDLLRIIRDDQETVVCNKYESCICNRFDNVIDLLEFLRDEFNE